MEDQEIKHGTTIAGIIVKDGIIVGSDAQGTWPGLDLKVKSYKLKNYELPQFKAGLASAGISAVSGVYSNLEHTIGKLTDKEYRVRKAEEAILLRGTTDGNLKNLEAAQRDTKIEITPTDFIQYLRDAIYDEQMRFQNLTVGVSAPKKETLPIEFIVGIVGKEGQTKKIYNVWSMGPFSEEKNYSVLGSGLLAASHVLEMGWKENMSAKDGLGLIVDAIQNATDQISSVGKGILIDVVTPQKIIHLEQYLKPEKFNKDKLVAQYARKVA